MITWHGLHSHCQICTRGCHLLWSAKQIFSFGKVPSFEVVHLQILHVVLHLHLDTVALIILATFELLVSIPGQKNQALWQCSFRICVKFEQSLLCKSLQGPLILG